MRFEGNSGSRVDIEAIGRGGLIVSVTEADAGEHGDDVSVARVVLDANHAEALADGILAACKELHARSIGGS